MRWAHIEEQCTRLHAQASARRTVNTSRVRKSRLCVVWGSVGFCESGKSGTSLVLSAEQLQIERAG